MSQETDYKWYCDNYPVLSRGNAGKWIVIKDAQVIGRADTFAGAVKKGDALAKRGEFIVQECDGTDEVPVEYL